MSDTVHVMSVDSSPGPPLDTQLAEARAWMQANDVPEIPLSFGTTPSLPRAFWQDEPGTLLRFVQHAKSLDARCVSFVAETVTPEMLAAAMVASAQSDDHDARHQLRDALTRARHAVGRVGSVVATAVCPAPPMLFVAVISESWFDVISDAADVEDEDGEESNAEERDPARFDSLAQELARHAEFQRAPSNAAREYIARRALAEHGSVDPSDLFNICNLAYGIFITDIKPQQDLELQSKAKTMLAAGEKRGAIANALEITPSKLAKLLS